MSEKAALKSGFVNSLECFIPGTFARIIFVLPEKNSKISVTGGGYSPPRPSGSYAYVWIDKQTNY